MTADFTSRRLSQRNKMADDFPDNDIAISLEKALRFAGKRGEVATLPWLLHYGFTGEDFTSNSQEYVLTTPGGNHALLIFHGDCIFSTPERLRDATYEGLHKGGGIRLTKEEHKSLLTGKIDGEDVPYFDYDDIPSISVDLPRFGIVIDYGKIRNVKSGPSHPVDLSTCMLFTARTVHPVFYEGAMRLAVQHGDTKVRHFYGADGDDSVARDSFDNLLGDFPIDNFRGKKGRKILHQHPYHVVDPSVPQGHIISMGSDDYGICSGYLQFHSGHYVGIRKQGQWVSATELDKKRKPVIGKDVRESLVEVIHSDKAKVFSHK